MNVSKAEPAREEQWHAGWVGARSLYPVDAHDMPRPIWATRGFADEGPTAWDKMRSLVPGRQGAISIYVHLPFCTTRCPFCDCHATVAPRRSSDIMGRYVRRLCQEVERWRDLGRLSTRPVTTVHMGGGTPNALPAEEFAQTVRSLTAGFGTDHRTEWAIETSSQCLDPGHAGQLADLGFTRIHIGVQTLRPSLRSMLGRRDPADTVLLRIEEALQRNWVVSADMLYGLPRQTVADLLSDLETLAQAGIHGISLYRLNHGAHNHRFMLRHGLANRGPARLYADYTMFMEAARQLTSLGFTRNHFTHFAKARDLNLYSRHAIRGEDLLALGATADGVFGDYYYRHSALAGYLKGDDEVPPLQGGGTFTPAEQRARPLVAQLMSGEITGTAWDRQAMRFLEKLTSFGLLSHEAGSHRWTLTPLGSWFAGECAAEASRIYDASAAGMADDGRVKKP